MKARSENERDTDAFRKYLRDIGREIQDLAHGEEGKHRQIGNAAFEKAILGSHAHHLPKTLSFSGYEENPFYYNLGGGTFVEIGVALGVCRVEDGRGVVSADFDGDGDLDLALRNVFEPSLLLFRNHAGTGNALEVRLRGKKNRFGIGARVTVDGRMQELVCGEGYLSGNAPVLHFGLGTSPIASKVVIRWPGGDVQELRDVSRGILTVTEGGGAEHAPFRAPSQASAATDVRPAHVGEKLELELESLEGSKAKTAGKLSVICVWSTTCASCMEESKHFEAFDALLKKRGGAYFAVNVDDDVLERVGKTPIPTWIGKGLRARLLNPSEPLVPTTLVIGPDGVLKARHVGVLTPEELERLLD